MTTVSPPRALRSWQGQRILQTSRFDADSPLAAAAPEPISKEI